MKELRAQAAADVAAPLERCRALLADVEGYPAWYPDVVRHVEALERAPDGTAATARAALHVPNVPLVSDVRLVLAVAVAGDRVTLTRVAHGAEDKERFQVAWQLAPKAPGTRVELALEAALSLPRLVPIGGVGQGLAEGFVAAAARALDDPAAAAAPAAGAQ